LSKLFDTLEQIRRNESYHVSGNTPEKPRRAANSRATSRTLLIAMILAGGFAAVYFTLPSFTGKTRPSATVTDYPAGSAALGPAPPPPLPTGRTPVASLPGKDLIKLNNSAVKMVENRDHWRGIFIFAGILDREPGSIEAMINLGVALAELGLTEPAIRYLRQAQALDHNHPALRTNLAILKQAGITGDEFSAAAKGGKG